MLLALRKFGDVGIVTDAPAHELPPNAMTGGVNVVFRDGAARKISGNAVLAYDIGDPATWFETWQYQVGSYRQAVSTDAGAIAVWNGSAWAGASIQNQAGAPATLSATTQWQSTVFGKFAVMNNGIEMPVYSWNSATSSSDGSVFRMIPAWGAATSPSGAVSSIRAHRNFLIAVGVANAPYTVYWSDAAASDSFPASWDYASTTNLAGYALVAASDGPLVDSCNLMDMQAIYTQHATYALQYVGGSDVFALRRLLPHGLINRDCAVQFQNRNFCIGDHIIYVHDGLNVNRVAQGIVEDRFFSELSDATKCHCVADESRNEIWTYYTSGSVNTQNRALIWNWKSNTWTFVDLPGYSCIAVSNVIEAPVTIGALTGSIGSLGGTIGEFGRTGSHRILLASTGEDAAVAFGLYRLNVGNRFIADYYDAYIERTGIDLDEVGGNATRQMHLRSITPQITGSGVVDIQIGTQRSAGDSVLWGDIRSIDLDNGADYKVDVRQTGRYLAWRIGSWSGTPTGSAWSMTGMDIDVIDGGR